MNVSWTQAAIAAALVVAFLMFFPAPKGCGCAKRKQKLQEMGGDIFGG